MASKKKKKVYKNIYKEQREAEANPKPEKKKPLTFKAYVTSIAIVSGFAAFFTQNTAICIVSLVLFLLTAYFLGKEHFFFLGIGSLLALLVALLNDVSYLIELPLVWSLFYLVLLIAGIFITYRAKRGK